MLPFLIVVVRTMVPFPCTQALEQLALQVDIEMLFMEADPLRCACSNAHVCWHSMLGCMNA